MGYCFETILNDDIERINRSIEKSPYLFANDSDAYKVINAEYYALSAGGKRIRPVLCMEFYKLFGGTEDISDIAACLEYIHTFSLIHDDMPEMDNDDLRRGKPSVHIKYGQDVALLAGDGLSILPFEIISDMSIDNRIDSKIAVELIKCISAASGNNGMIMGQMMDLCYNDSDVSIDYLVKMSELKTGRLLMASCAAGAILSGADDIKKKKASDYAYNLGLAFQIVDDVLDVIGDEKKLGKPIGSDKDRRKATFADILGIDGAKRLAKEYTEASISAISGYANSEFLIELAGKLLLRDK